MQAVKTPRSRAFVKQTINIESEIHRQEFFFSWSALSVSPALGFGRLQTEVPPKPVARTSSAFFGKFTGYCQILEQMKKSVVGRLEDTSNDVLETMQGCAFYTHALSDDLYSCDIVVFMCYRGVS